MFMLQSSVASPQLSSSSPLPINGVVPATSAVNLKNFVQLATIPALANHSSQVPDSAGKHGKYKMFWFTNLSM